MIQVFEFGGFLNLKNHPQDYQSMDCRCLLVTEWILAQAYTERVP